MLRPTFALMNRSLNHDIRRRRFHLLRLAVVISLFCLLIATHANSLSLAAPGLSFFRTIAWLNFAAIAAAGVGFFATAITEEKEEMTLELFLIAGISPLAILIGKGVNRFFLALSVLVVQIPFTILAVTLGGVKLGQIAAAYIALAAYLFLAANIGLFFSVICSRTGAAMFFTAVTIGMLLACPLLINTATQTMIARGFIANGGAAAEFASHTAQCFDDASIITQLDNVMMAQFASPAIGFQVQSNLAGGAVLFFVSWLLFALVNTGASHAAPSRGWVARPDRLFGCLAPARPWTNALAWKDFHFMAGGKTMLLVRALLIPALAAVLYGGVYIAKSWIDWWDAAAEILAGVALTFLAGEMIVQASRVFSEEVKWRTLGNIGMLPRSIGRVANDKVRGCLLGCLPALVWLTFAVASAPDVFLTYLDDVDEGMWALCFVAEFVLFLYVTAYLSLVVKWGSLPLAVLAFAVYLAFSMSCFATVLVGPLIAGSDVGTIVYTSYNIAAATVLSGFLHAAVGRRLSAAKGL